MTAAITFHDVLHGFWEVHGTGTATLKVKLIQQITATREAVLYKVCLELQKLYNTLDQGRCLDILTEYRLVPMKLHLLGTYWGWFTMVVRIGWNYDPPFKGYRGVIQGGHLYPKLFNVVLGTIIRH